MNVEQRILDMERELNELKMLQWKLKSSIKEPESPKINDEWYNPLTGATQVWDGKQWNTKPLSSLWPLKPGASSAFVWPNEAGFLFKVTDLGAVYIKSGEITASLIQNKAWAASQVTIDANGISVRDSGWTLIFEAKPTWLFIGADKIRINGKQPFHTIASGAPAKTGYTLPVNVAHIPMQTADGTTYNVLVTP